MAHKVDIGKDFSRYPAGRYPADGQFNGQTFREKFLKESLSKLEMVEVHLDNAISYGSSFLEEAFGGLIRVEGFSEKLIVDHVELVSRDSSLIQEILEYVSDAEKVKNHG